MQAVAPSGSISITESTRRLVEGFFQIRSRGRTLVKGLSEPVMVYEVTGVGPLRTRIQRSAGRGLTKFVGRAVELEQMKRALELARNGHGQIVATIGEHGVGKSRLFMEFKSIAQGGCQVLEAFSVLYGKVTAYMPVLELLRDYFGIWPEDGWRSRREKVAGKIVTLDRALETCCHICSRCSVSLKATIRWRKWTRNRRSVGPWRRSKVLSCVRASISR